MSASELAELFQRWHDAPPGTEVAAGAYEALLVETRALGHPAMTRQYERQRATSEREVAAMELERQECLRIVTDFLNQSCVACRGTGHTKRTPKGETEPEVCTACAGSGCRPRSLDALVAIREVAFKILSRWGGQTAAERAARIPRLVGT